MIGYTITEKHIYLGFDHRCAMEIFFVVLDYGVIGYNERGLFSAKPHRKFFK